MMISQTTTGTLALTRSVRDVVAHQPELVTEVWCRKIFRHILQLLERDYALRRAHAPITPDTVGFDEHGEPALVADEDAPQPSEAADVQSLGAVIHYALTLEEVPTMSLRKRAPEGYSESLLTAVDKCMATNPADRPQTITELRNLLGIVALGPTIGAAPPPPVFIEATAAPSRRVAGMGKWQRWVMMGLAAIVLLAAGSALWMLLRGTTSNDSVVLTLPETVPPRAQAPQADVPPPAAPIQAQQTAEAAQPLPAPETAQQQTAQQHTTQPQAPQQQAVQPAPEAGPAVAKAAPAAPASRKLASAPARRAPASAAAASTSASANDDDDVTTYKLMVKPWGTIYVDGSERGVSPPLKLLSLPAGQHTVRIVNPNYRDRVLRVTSGKQDSARIDVNFKD
jgi:hypothetical protein